MGVFKSQMIEAEDRFLNEIAGWPSDCVCSIGGDRMSNSFAVETTDQMAELAESVMSSHDGIENAKQQDPPALPKADLSSPIIGAISTEKMAHGRMVLNGVCTHCACCGLPLTDAVSVERGMGGICSKKGYSEDPKDNVDDMMALIELSEYPELVEFLVKHYKPLGVRGLMNGLVRIACLNRKEPVHKSCCNAIEYLGYVRLANTLRSGLTIGHIKDSKTHLGCLAVWIKWAHWTRAFSNACKNIPGAFFDRAEKGWIIPKHPASKTALWHALLASYPGEAIKTVNGPVKIAATTRKTDGETVI